MRLIYKEVNKLILTAQRTMLQTMSYCVLQTMSYCVLQSQLLVTATFTASTGRISLILYQ